jgi:recombinational DNA repair protein (RecF pathway)
LGWELALLQETGFGLDLTACAVTPRRSASFPAPPTASAARSTGVLTSMRQMIQRRFKKSSGD